MQSVGFLKFCLEISGFRKVNLHVSERKFVQSRRMCVNSRADCIHKCHQGFELGVEAQENEENVINETFPKVD